MENETKYQTISEPLYRLLLQANALVHAYKVYGEITESQMAEYNKLDDEYQAWYKKLYANREEGV